MQYQYFVNLDYECEEYEDEIKQGAFYQNLAWIRNSINLRLEYLGTTIDEYGYNYSTLILTGVSDEICYKEELKELFPEFTKFIDKEIFIETDDPILSFNDISIGDVGYFYSSLKGKIDEDWFYDSENVSDDEENKFLENLKTLYYDCNLESLLYKNLRDALMEYVTRIYPQKPLTSEQQQHVDDMTEYARTISNLFGVEVGEEYKDPLPVRIVESNTDTTIIFGGYCANEERSYVILPNYENSELGIKTQILDFAFCGWNNLNTVNILSVVDDFGVCVFGNCAQLKEVSLNGNMKVLPQYTFHQCLSLETIEIPSSVSIIGAHAFENCNTLKDVKLKEDTCLTIIDDGAFSLCPSLINFTMPETLDEIGSYAFEASGLVNITMPDSVGWIGEGAFSNCKNLIDVELSYNINELPVSCFSGCDKLTKIKWYKPVKIGDRAFLNCYQIKELNIPDGTREIGNNVFSGCDNLRKISFPESLVSIGHCQFDKDTIVFCKEGSYIHNIAIENGWNVIHNE